MGAYFVLITLILAAVGLMVWALTLRYRRRELQHRERMAALEKGASLPELTDEVPALRGGRQYMLRGLIWLFLGIAVSLVLLAIAASTGGPASIEERYRLADNLRRNGAPEDVVNKVQNDTSPRDALPWGFALFGLIPAAVGAAYLIVYRQEQQI